MQLDLVDSAGQSINKSVKKTTPRIHYLQFEANTDEMSLNLPEKVINALKKKNQSQNEKEKFAVNFSNWKLTDLDDFLLGNPFTEDDKHLKRFRAILISQFENQTNKNV